MARQKLGAFERIRRKKKEKLEEKKFVQATTPSPALVPEVNEGEIEAARAEAEAAADKARNLASKGNLVSAVKLEAAEAEAEEKAVAVRVLERAAEPVPQVSAAAAQTTVSGMQATLNVFDWALILFSVGVDILKISKWYAVGGAAALAALYYYAQNAGWLDKLGL